MSQKFSPHLEQHTRGKPRLDSMRGFAVVLLDSYKNPRKTCSKKWDYLTKPCENSE